MGLQAHEAVDHLHPGPLQIACPADVARLVEARLDLHQGGHRLAGLGRFGQGLQDR